MGSRLIKKNFVKAEGTRRKRIYSPLIPRSEYDSLLTRRIVNELFDGSLKNFVSAFTFTEGLTREETLALKTMLRRKGEE